MDFIDWAEHVFSELVVLHKADSFNRSIGVDERKLAAAIFGEALSRSPDFYTSRKRMAILEALDDLKRCGVLEEHSGSRGFYKPSPRVRGLERDFIPLWQAICRDGLDPDQEQLLKAVAELSHFEETDFGRVQEVGDDPVLASLGWAEGMDKAWPIVQELDNGGLIKAVMTSGPSFEARVTYRGLVWLNKRAFTVEAMFIDELVKEWETTSVEFKREVHTDTPGEKAELTKDVLALVNTQASGQRWLIVGFDNGTREWACPPDPKLTQDHIEQLMSVYTDPVIDVRYEVVGYRDGKVGKLEVLRNPKKLPYHVKKSVGDARKRVEEGDVFVRHGSQVEHPTPAELRALEEEGDRARAASS